MLHPSRESDVCCKRHLKGVPGRWCRSRSQIPHGDAGNDTSDRDPSDPGQRPPPRPNDEPVGFSGSFRVHRLRTRDNDPAANPQADPYELGEQIIERPVEVDAGGSGQIQCVADEEGPFRIVVTADDGSGREITGTTDLWVTQRGGRYAHYAYRDVELVGLASR